MYSQSIFIVLGFVALTAALPYAVVENNEGEEYLLVPLSRVRRQTIGGGINPSPNGGYNANINAQGTLLDNNRHRVDGSVFAQRDYKPKGPLTTGGQIDYTHKPSGSGLSVGTSNTRGFGTDLNVGGKYNIHSSKNADVSLQGQYQRHYGGPWGTGRPNYNVGLTGSYRF